MGSQSTDASPRDVFGQKLALQIARLTAKLLGLTLLIVALGFVMPIALIGGIQFSKEANYPEVFRGIVLLSVISSIVFFTLLAGASVLFFVRRHSRFFARHPISDRPVPVPPPPIAPPPFSGRLSRFLGDASPAAKPDSAEPQSRMAFFLAVNDMARRDPKPAEFFRRILWRIRQLVHGGS